MNSRRKKPIKRTPEDLRATAYHEAGHAVVTFAQGLTIDTVSIIPAEDYNGICLEPSVLGYRFESWRDRRAIARALIVVCYAGMHAQRLVDPNAADWHGDGDESDAFQLSQNYEVLPRYCSWVGDDAHDRYLDRLRQEAKRLVMKHRTAIAALAEALLQEKEVDRSAAEAIVEPLLNK